MSYDVASTHYAGVFAGVPTVQNATYRNPIEDWLRDAITDPKNVAGVAVNPRTAMGYAPVWSCLSKIAGHCGYLPYSIYAKDASDPRKRTEVTTHPVYHLLSYPNDYMTGQTFRETLTAHALFGNGRAYIVRDGRGMPAELIPLAPNETTTVLVKFEGDTQQGSSNDAARDGSDRWEKWHVVRFADGKQWAIPDADVLHIPGLGYDGIVGYSVIDLAKQSLGLGMAAEKASSKHFANGARPSFMLKAPPGVFRKEDEAKNFIDAFNERHGGVENDGRVGLLRDGIDLAMTQQSPRDSEWIAQRTFQRQEVALWFCIENMLGDDSSVSYNSLEEKNRAYITNCLTRWLTKWEMECANKLLTAQQKRSESHYFKFSTAALLRGNTSDRWNVYSLGRQMEVLSANDVRVLEDMEPIEGGDDYENPAINPKESGSDTMTEDEPTADPPKKPVKPSADPKENALRTVVEARLTDLIRVEIARVRQAAEKPAKFLAWLDTFYDAAEFGGRIDRVWRECGALGLDAAAYVAHSKAAILEASGKGSGEAFAAAIHEETESWLARAAVEAERICKETV
jgi:HK97 family phage portal protein